MLGSYIFQIQLGPVAKIATLRPSTGNQTQDPVIIKSDISKIAIIHCYCGYIE